VIHKRGAPGPRRSITRREGAGPGRDAVLLSCGHLYYLRSYGRWLRVKSTTCEKCRDGNPVDDWSKR
jgi:hypothetical protein